eukprot:jgi/Mesvir1/8392/Mv12637-RA.1
MKGDRSRQADRPKKPHSGGAAGKRKLGKTVAERKADEKAPPRHISGDDLGEEVLDETSDFSKRQKIGDVDKEAAENLVGTAVWKDEDIDEDKAKAKHDKKGKLAAKKLKQKEADVSTSPSKPGGNNQQPSFSAIVTETMAAQADWLRERYIKHFSKTMSSLELESFVLTESCMLPLTGAPANQRCQQVAQLTRKAAAKSGAAKGKGKGPPLPGGAPFLIILCSSAVRCTDVIRDIRAASQGCSVSKCFAKHFKLEEQVEMLKEPTDIAVGTPHRIGKLLDVGALSTERLRFVGLDMWLNPKQWSQFDIPEIRVDFWEMFRKHLLDKVSKTTNDGAKLFMF